MKRIKIYILILALLPFLSVSAQDALDVLFNPLPEKYMHYGDGIKGADILVVDNPGEHQDKVVESIKAVDPALVISRFNFKNQIWGMHYADSLGIPAVYLPNGSGLIFAYYWLSTMYKKGYLSEDSGTMFFSVMESNDYRYFDNPPGIAKYAIISSSCDENGQVICSYGPAMEFVEYGNVNTCTGGALTAKMVYIKKRIENRVQGKVSWAEVRELCRQTASNSGDWFLQSGYGTIDTSIYKLYSIMEVNQTDVYTTDDALMPAQFELFQNYPNPFNSETTISYNLAQDDIIKLSIHNIKGEIIDLIEDGFKSAGYYQKVINATGWPSGIYFLHLNTHGQRFIKKIKLVK